MVIFLSFVSVIIFHILGDKYRIRELYSSALTGSYVRLLMQYVGGEKMRLWEYKDLPLPLGHDLQIPIVLDFTLYPVAAYLFMQFQPKSLKKKLIHYLFWVLGGVLIESMQIWSNHLTYKHWNLFYSFLFFFTMAIIVEWQYWMVRRWWDR